MFVYNPPQTPWLSIVYRDEHVIVLNKPAGLLTVPGKAPEHKDSLEKRVQAVLPTALIVHRLDMATSGLIIMALDKLSQGQLGRQFQERQVQKRYRARLHGVLASASGTVELPLRCDWPNRPKQMVCYEHGKAALTKFECVAVQETSTEVLLYPVTGRSHQLRVHMQQLGHAIIGDRLYGCDDCKQQPRLLLHAEWIAFRHPRTGAALEFELPAEFTLSDD